MAFKTDKWRNEPDPSADDVTRALPHALGPEKSLLSSMLQDPQEYIGLAIEEKLSEAHFYLPSHSTLFGFLCELFGAGEEIELVSLVQKLLDRGLLDRCGGPAAITDLYTYAPSPGHFRNHMKHVKDKFVLRSIIQSSNEAIADSYDSPDDPLGVLDGVESRLSAIRDGSSSVKAKSKREAVELYLSELQERIDGKRQTAGIPTGFEDLDRKTGGLKPGEMFVIAARPSMGKTSLMMNIVENVCLDQGVPSMVFSLEMSNEQLVARLINSRAKFAESQLSRGYTPNKGDLQRIQRASMDVMQAKLEIDDTPAITINELRARARRKMREVKLGLIAIDYLQLMRSKSKQADGSREREVAEISAGIKGLAKELGIPIIILAQINRDVEKRTGKALGVPRMSDLRESGAIEQDADMVGLLYRTAYYAADDAAKEAEAGRARLILAKNRNGETGPVELTFIAELMRFETGRPVQEELPNIPPKQASRWDR